MNIKLEPPKLMDLKPRITVIGIGGAGCNAINNMIATQLDGVEFIVANTDAQSLSMSSAERRIQLGVNITEGLGAGARPEVGEAAAREAAEDIKAEITGSHMVFIAAGMGGGTGTGAAAVIAEIARDLGILTVGIVSKPFQFEGARRMRTAEAGIDALEGVVDTLIVIPNQNLFRIANERTTFAEAFRLADQVLYSGIACIVDLIIKEGLINLDFADVQAVMKGMGTAMMGTGEASGEDRALNAANEAIANPLLDDVTLSGAQGLLISIVGGGDLTLYEVDTAASHIRKEVASEANIIVGATTEEGMDDKIRVSIVASGMSGQRAANPRAPVDHFVPKAEPSLPVTETITQPQPASAPLLGNAQADPEMTEADEFAKALSEAMDATPGADASVDNAAAWQSSDGVVVEEGFAGNSATRRPPPLPMRDENDTASSGFQPAPPAQARRAAPRMPDVSDFPELAQREYFSKMEASQSAPEAPRNHPDPHTLPVPRQNAAPGQQSRPSEQSPQPQGKAPSTANQKPGFLRRLRRSSGR